LPNPEPTFSVNIQKISKEYLVRAYPSPDTGDALKRMFPTWKEFESIAERLPPKQDFQKLHEKVDGASFGIQFPPEGLVTLSVVQALGLK
jgi:hypothetical protein